jgi:hypothetical protein
MIRLEKAYRKDATYFDNESDIPAFDGGGHSYRYSKSIKQEERQKRIRALFLAQQRLLELDCDFLYNQVGDMIDKLIIQ